VSITAFSVCHGMRAQDASFAGTLLRAVQHADVAKGAGA
jgi:hypothetical protein